MCLGASDRIEPTEEPEAAPAPERASERVSRPAAATRDRAKQSRLGLRQFASPLAEATTLTY